MKIEINWHPIVTVGIISLAYFLFVRLVVTRQETTAEDANRILVKLIAVGILIAFALDLLGFL